MSPRPGLFDKEQLVALGIIVHHLSRRLFRLGAEDRDAKRAATTHSASPTFASDGVLSMRRPLPAAGADWVP